MRPRQTARRREAKAEDGNRSDRIGNAVDDAMRTRDVSASRRDASMRTQRAVNIHLNHRRSPAEFSAPSPAHP